jgi:hypothetical protein
VIASSGRAIVSSPPSPPAPADHRTVIWFRPLSVFAGDVALTAEAGYARMANRRLLNFRYGTADCAAEHAVLARRMRQAMTGVAVLIFVIVVITLAALAGLFAVRRFVPRERLAQHTDIAGYVYAVIGVVYGVILAQVVVAAWEEYRDASGAAASEAAALLNLDRLSGSWPEDDRTQVRAALIDYAELVIDVEWPAMEAGNYDLAPIPEPVSNLWQTSVGESAGYAAALDQLDALDEARRARYLLGERTLPVMMTVTLLVGGVVTVAFSYLFAVEDGWIHGLITASLAILVGLLLFLEFELETPFEGIDAIKPTAMQLALEDFVADSNGNQ